MNKKYWDNIYNSKSQQDVSWYQQTPTKSLELILDLKLEFMDTYSEAIVNNFFDIHSFDQEVIIPIRNQIIVVQS